VFDDIELPTENTQNLLRDAAQQIKLGNRQKAQQITQQLMENDPNNADVWYLAGYLYSSPEKKRQAFERALRLDPAHKKARQALNSLQ
jgi:tetratricopeptide (TPR) repeat protein